MNVAPEPRKLDPPDSALPAPCDTILILTTSTGAGHDSVAVALEQAIKGIDPRVGVCIFDPLRGAGSGEALSPGRWYNAIVEYSPWLWRLIYRATNSEWAVRLGTAVGARLWAGRLRSLVLTERPGLVVSVHPLCTRLAARVLRTVPDAPPLHCVVTDLVTIHRCWACGAVDTFYVATAEARHALLTAGIPRVRIEVTGLPLRASFGQAPEVSDDHAIRRVLLLGGGHPSRRIAHIARAIVSSRLPLRLVVVCGHNRRLHRHLSRALGARATVLGWREDIITLMRWSSVIVSKGGPTTLAEAMSQARPLIIFHALKDQEAGNVALAERIGSGRHIPDTNALVRALAACPRTVPMGDETQAAWWGSAAQRVASRILTAQVRNSSTGVKMSHPPGHVDDPDPSGRVIQNPISGERIVVRQSGAQTGGRLLSFDLFLPPGAHVPSRHVHPNQEEKFTVLEGRMRFRLGLRRAFVANPGDTVVVRAGTAHWFGNPGEGVSRALVEARPALRLQEVFERSAAMDVVKPFPGTRMPRISDLAPFMIEFRRELAVPHLPAFLVNAFLTPLAWWGRRSRDRRAGAAR